MPPDFQREGIDAAKEIRKRRPGTGIVVLSQFDDPEYAVSLLADGAAGYAYLLKDRVAEGDQLARAIREVASGGSLIDPKIVEALVNPLRDDTLTPSEEELLRQVVVLYDLRHVGLDVVHDPGRGRPDHRPRGLAGGQAPLGVERDPDVRLAQPAGIRVHLAHERRVARLDVEDEQGVRSPGRRQVAPISSDDWRARYRPSTPGAAWAIVAMSSIAGSTGRSARYFAAILSSRRPTASGVPMPSVPRPASSGAP